MANNYGKTWWGQQWLNTLTNIDYDNRLPRGRSYANNGSVTKITIKDNRIEAKVKGSRPKPYNVDITLPPFFDPELSEFIQKLAQKPTIISKLLNRELDPEVLTIAENLGLKVFPKQWTDFKMQCSCPDWAVPCKHLAAVVYKVSAEIDNNPFLVFELHLLNLLEELNKLGIYIDKQATDILHIKDIYFDTNKPKKIDFNTENAYQKLNFSKLKTIQEPITALLSDFPVFYQNSGNFKEKYVVKFNKIVKNAEKVVNGKISLEHLFISAQNNLKDNINKHSQHYIKIDDNFDSKVVIDEKPFSFLNFLQQISQIPNAKTLDFQPTTAALHTVLQFAIQLLAHGAVTPQIYLSDNKNYSIRWLPAMLSKDVRSLVEKLNEIVPPNIFFYEDKKNKNVIDKDQASNILSLFLTEIIHILNGQSGEDVFLNLFFTNANYSFNQPGEEALSGGIQSWLQKYYITQGNYRHQIAVEELPNEHFLITLNVFDKKESFATQIPLKSILNQKQYDKNRYEILQSLTQLSSFINGLDDYINSQGSENIIMDLDTFSPFLIDIVPAIQLLDIDILLPKALQEILKPKTSVKLKRKAENKSYIRLDQMLDFDWQVALGDNLVDEKEFKKLLTKSERLIKYKSNYIYVSDKELEKIHKHFSESQQLNAFQLLRTALSGEYQGAKIALTDEVQTMIDELTNVSDIDLPKGINATLRPYQHRGFSWMYRNSKIGFGSVLADDMGLGKTLQVITTLQKFKEDKILEKEKILVVAPTGLLSNWQKEIEKFAPTLRPFIFHGTHRKIENEDFDVLITSYGIMRSDANLLKKRKWQALILDEAQNIKNVNTEQTKAIKTIGANNFIAMSGTPVENRLRELWSIMDFSNRGLLGTVKEFNDNFALDIEVNNDVEVAEKLKKVTSPFMMRRLKSDKTIISDLPDKIEIDSYATLAKEQASLYEQTLQKAMEDIEGIEGKDSKALFVRQGLVLQMILALKQICNHPTQFLKNNLIDPNLSGKMELLFDKLDSIVESNEKVLIFTQFTEMGNLLKQFIAERYQETPMFYHGGSTVKDRNTMVDNFQNNRADKIFILSLKAAGTGLNLTAANHVIHYDLWWNPAVEAQATDRAYRIGQKSNVMVHRFITKNTFEERINDMIQSKKALADMTVATGENWIGNLSNKELRELFQN
jgi:SNF2 family DNA or RNA helicase/uncharacterized Zn finger protein